MLVRAIVTHYDPSHCYRTRGQVFNHDGPMHPHIVPVSDSAPIAGPEPTPARVPLDVQQQLAKLTGALAAAEKAPAVAQTVPAAPGAEIVPHLNPTPIKGALPQLPSGALPPDVIAQLAPSPEPTPAPASMPAPPSQSLPESMPTPADDGRDMLG